MGQILQDHSPTHLYEGYGADGTVVPLRYAPLMGLYAAGVAGYGVWFHRSGRRLPTPSAGDLALLGVGTFKLSRLLARDKVTSVLRAPFTRFKGTAKGPEVNEAPRGRGLRRGVGELATCPFCVSQWVGTALTAVYLAQPALGRALATLLAAVTISDGLQYAETALQQAVE